MKNNLTGTQVVHLKLYAAAGGTTGLDFFAAALRPTAFAVLFEEVFFAAFLAAPLFFAALTFFTVVPDSFRCAAQRRLCASAMRRRPSALMRRLSFGRLAAAVDRFAVDIDEVPGIPRSAEIALSIAAFCSSSSLIICCTSINQRLLDNFSLSNLSRGGCRGTGCPARHLGYS